MEVLSSNYLIPFHLLPVLWEPTEFLLYSLVSDKSQSLQGEVDKMLGEGPWRSLRTPVHGTTADCFWHRRCQEGGGR